MIFILALGLVVPRKLLCYRMKTKQYDEILLCYANNDSDGKLHFIGSTLPLRGLFMLDQPFVDVSRSILVFNGTSQYYFRFEVLLLLDMCERFAIRCCRF